MTDLDFPWPAGSPVVPHGLRVCVAGLGVAGQLHTALLRQWGARTVTVDPDPLRGASATTVAAVPTVDVWSVCTPTATHLDTLRAVLDRDPAARIIVEKPLCRPGELDEFEALLAAHPHASVALMDQYRHARAPELVGALTGMGAEDIRVAFVKDRRADIAEGRFVDRDYGVLGYEWLHMLAVLRAVLPQAKWQEYLASESEVDGAELDGLSCAAAEHVQLRGGPRISLFTSVVGIGAHCPLPVPDWLRGRPTGIGGRLRLLLATGPAGTFSAELDPVVDEDGHTLDRNVHRLGHTRAGTTRYWTVHDSPMTTALGHALAALVNNRNPAPDLRPMRRLAALAALLPTAPGLATPA